jgi:hypothetical protein
MKLYEITNELQRICDYMGDAEELTQEMFDNLDGLQEDFETKAISVASYIKNLEAEEQAIAEAIKGMTLRKARLAKQAESLSDYLQLNLQKLSINEIKSSPYFKIRLKQCPVSVEVFDESVLPAEYLREKITVTVDKIKLKETMSEGVEVPGATLQRKIKLEIK